jgi:hypothetical protein
VIENNGGRSNEENSENLDVEDDIIYIETVKVTNTNYFNCGASTSRGRDIGRGRGQFLTTR